MGDASGVTVAMVEFQLQSVRPAEKSTGVKAPAMTSLAPAAANRRAPGWRSGAQGASSHVVMPLRKPPLNRRGITTSEQIDAASDWLDELVSPLVSGSILRLVQG